MGGQSDGAEIETLVSEGCVCSNENYFSVFVAQSIVTIQHQVCDEKSRYKNIVLLGMLTTAQHKEAIEIECKRRKKASCFTTQLKIETMQLA